MNNPQVAEQAARWLLKTQDGLTPQQEREFARWLREPDNAAEFRLMRAAWQDSGHIPPHQVARLRPPAARRPRRWRFAGLQACALLLIAALVYVPLRDEFAAPVYHAAWQTGQGELREVTLPDGTTISLDAQTQLSVRYFPHRREITLERGQAFFAVAHLPQRPLVVYSGPSRTTVIGTAFQVRYLPHTMSGDGADVTVSEGAVRVGPRDRWRNDWWRLMSHLNVAQAARYLTVLHASQRAISDASGALLTTQTIDEGDIAAWKASRIVFDNTRLDMALAEFARYGEVPLRLASADVAALRVSGSFDVSRAASFARALPDVLPVKLKTSGNQIIIQDSVGPAKKS